MIEDEFFRLAAVRRGQPPIFSWDDACTHGCSYQGYGLDELLLRLLFEEAKKSCDQCGAGDCTHEAARLVLFEIAEHVRSLRDAYGKEPNKAIRSENDTEG